MALGLPSIGRAQSATLKISHQFPGGSLTEGDFRDRLCRRFAADVEKQTKGALKFEVYPNSSLMKTIPQFAALRKGALDLSLYPLSYAGGEVAGNQHRPHAGSGHELRAGLLVEERRGRQDADAGHGREGHHHRHAGSGRPAAWRARAKPLVQPEDAKGMKVRGGSREMDMILKQAGASVLTLPSNEIYAAMQTGAMDAGMTSSTSLISFRLEEVSKSLTTGRGRAYWFMFEPLLMSKQIFDALPKDQQAAIMAAAPSRRNSRSNRRKADDKAVADVYLKAGAKVYDLDEATVKKWQAIARETAWKDYGEKSESNAKLLAAAIKTL